MEVHPVDPVQVRVRAFRFPKFSECTESAAYLVVGTPAAQSIYRDITVGPPSATSGRPATDSPLRAVALAKRGRDVARNWRNLGRDTEQRSNLGHGRKTVTRHVDLGGESRVSQLRGRGLLRGDLYRLGAAATNENSRRSQLDDSTHALRPRAKAPRGPPTRVDRFRTPPGASAPASGAALAAGCVGCCGQG